MFCFVLLYITQWSVWYYRNLVLIHPASIYQSPNKCQNPCWEQEAFTERKQGMGVCEPVSPNASSFQLFMPRQRSEWPRDRRSKILFTKCLFPSCSLEANGEDFLSTESTGPLLLSSMWRTGYLSFTISRSLLKFMSIESVMLFNHLILCHPLLLLPSIFPRIRVFSNESSLCIKWSKSNWSFSLSISPSNEYSGLISFKIDWFDLLAVQGTQKSSLAPQFKASNVSGCVPVSPSL